MEKCFLRPGQTLTVTCLVDKVTGEGFFLVMDGHNVAVQASEIVVGDVTFSADQRTRVVFHHPTLGYLEGQDFKALPKEEKDEMVEQMEIPLTASLPQVWAPG